MDDATVGEADGIGVGTCVGTVAVCATVGEIDGMGVVAAVVDTIDGALKPLSLCWPMHKHARAYRRGVDGPFWRPRSVEPFQWWGVHILLGRW